MSGLQLSCKIVLLGSGAVGKTSLRRTYLGQNFNKSYNMTIGADFAAKSLEIGGEDGQTNKITANIWDLSGQMRFKIMRETYYRGVSGAIFVYDITRPETFIELEAWVNEIRKNNNNSMVTSLVVANKLDLIGTTENIVPMEKGMSFADELAKRYGIEVQFVEASALTGENVAKAFETLIYLLYNSFEKSL